MKWFRLYAEARNDAKLRYLSDSEFRVWFNLLCFASEQETRGTIPASNLTLLAVEVAGGDEELLEATLDKLRTLAIIQVNESEIVFINWEKRQYDNPSDMPEEVKKRVTKHRSKQGNDPVTTCNDSVTRRNALDTDTDIYSTSLLRKDGDTAPVSPEPLTEKQEAPPKKERRSRKETNPDVKVFLDYYRDTFLSRFGEPPVINWGKDGAIVKRLLSTYGLEKLKGLLGDFFNSQDVFVKERGGYTIGVFKYMINKLISVKGQKQKSEGVVYYDLTEKLATLKRGNGQ